jgi:hypothetical protein
MMMMMMMMVVVMVMVMMMILPDVACSCCEMRLLQIRNQAESSELIPKYVYEEPS